MNKRVRILPTWWEEVYRNLTGTFDGERVHLDLNSQVKVAVYNQRHNKSYIENPKIVFGYFETVDNLMETE